MKLRLKHPQVIPYGGSWIINRPDLGVVGKGLQFHNLVVSVKAWRQANGCPIGVAFEEEVEQAACLTYPAECEEIHGPNLRKRNLQLSDIVTGTKTMLRFKLSGSPLVSAEEANRRASICVKCPYNTTFAKPCAGICDELKNIVQDIIGARGTQHDARLHSCNICGCFLQAAVWVPNEISVPPLHESQKEAFKAISHCWKTLESKTT